MSHAPIPLADDLVSKFRGQTIAQSLRYFKCIIQNERIVNVYEHRQTASLETDWGTIAGQTKEDEPAFFIVRLEGSKRWLLVSYVPETAAVKAKMTFATAKNFLKEKLGEEYFVDELNTSTKEELTYSQYQASKAPVNALSMKEIELNAVHKQEEEARKDFATSLQQKTQGGATNSPQNAKTSSPGIGGYHSVSLPLTPKAKSELGKLKDGINTFVELFVTDNHESIDVVGSAKSINGGEGVAKEISGVQPRFFVFVTNKISKQAALIYYCPDKSPQKSRMVYSTAKQGLADEVSKLGVTIATRKIEISEAADVVEELKRNLNTTGLSPATNMKKGGLEEGGGGVKASNVRTTGGSEHEVYGLMKDNVTQKTETKKKIVIPPPGAYGF